MTAVAALDEASRALVAEAAEWRLIELLFQCPSAAWKGQLADLAREVGDEDLRAAAVQATEQATEGAFHSIFGPGGPAPAREASYQGTLQLGQLMSELKEYYEAFAFHPVSAEPLDHVSVECGFVGFLRLKEAFARARGSEDEAGVAQESAQRFIAEHLSYIAEPLSVALEHSGEAYLELAGRSLRWRAGPRPRQIFDILDQEADAAGDGVFECGQS